MNSLNANIDYDQASLPALVDLARSGNREAFRHIMTRCNQRLFRVARGVLNDDAEAEDALQEAYFRAFTHIASFRSEARVSTWLTRIVLNECFGRLRKRRNTVPLDVLDAVQGDAQIVPFPTRPGMEDPANATGRMEIRELLETSIAGLPAAFRTVFIMRAVEEYSTEETALMLDIPAATVKTRLHRARVLLREAMQDSLQSSLRETFPFLGARCAALTERVMQRLDRAADDSGH